MSSQRCIRELLPRLQYSRRRAPIRAGALNTIISPPYQSTSAFTTTVYQRSLQSSPEDNLSSLLNPTANSAAEIVALKTEQTEIRETTPCVPLVPLPPLLPYPSRANFFEYADQRTASTGSRVISTYTKSVVQANALVSQIKGPVIGMDLEWRPQGEVNVSLVQICDENQILLIHICNMQGHLPNLLQINTQNSRML